MKTLNIRLLSLLLFVTLTGVISAADIVPPEVQLPGTQPGETSNFESPNKCDNCHAGYNDAGTTGAPQDEPATGWRGAAMGNAGRDPIFWATMAIAEQDFDGAGDLCIRCHSTGGWYGGRSTPTDASGLATSDSDGVDCDTCHSMTNTDDSEHLGIMNTPFVANCSDDPTTPEGSCQTGEEGYYGSGMTSIWAGSDKLGPYFDTDARHQFMQSKFHRSVDFCGTCHDVSNSVVGDLAPGNGAQLGAPHVVSSQDVLGGPNLGGPVEEKAAFNNPPYAYGVVERTFSEYKSSAYPRTRVAITPGAEDEDGYDELPGDLKVPGGSIDVTYQAAYLAGNGGDYADGDPRYFSCQSCHMRPTVSAGANKRGVEIRDDLPQHDHTGGNYWLADMIKYQDSKGHLRLGGGLTDNQLAAIDLGQLRAVEHLQQAASLTVAGDTLKVVNLTGHKLISGYPEGRRMWLNIKWYDDNGLIREDGAYGPLLDETGNPVEVRNPADGSLVKVESILDLDGENTRIYEAHYAMTKEWADTLSVTGKPDTFVLSFNRYTGAVDYTLGDLRTGGGYHETFHFALNNTVVKDNRIPPYGMSYDEAKRRNALPVPADQYGGTGNGSIYNYYDEIELNPPLNAHHASIELLYQGTSWEYIQFLNNANDGSNAFLGAEGVNMLEAWINAEVPVAMKVAGDRRMVPPVVMASATWGSVPPVDNIAPICTIDTPDGDVSITEGGSVSYTGTATDSDGNIVSYSWSFGDGTPGSSTVEDPGTVTYNSTGTYTASFTATDENGASCGVESVTITVDATGGPVACGDYTNRSDCNNDASCKWSGKQKVCLNKMGRMKARMSH